MVMMNIYVENFSPAPRTVLTIDCIRICMPCAQFSPDFLFWVRCRQLKEGKTKKKKKDFKVKRICFPLYLVYLQSDGREMLVLCASVCVELQRGGLEQWLQTFSIHALLKLNKIGSIYCLFPISFTYTFFPSNVHSFMCS